MANIGIYYGSTTGNTEALAQEIGKKLGITASNIHDVNVADADFKAYDVLLFGSSTYGIGDLQDDWDEYIKNLKKTDLSNKKVALFGCGDSSSYADSFGDALSIIYNAIKNSGCKIIGKTSIEGYTFESSEAIVDGQFVGLLVDQDNEPELTDQRVASWIEHLKKEI